MELTLQNKYDIKRVQNRLLAMAKTIAKILEKHSIPYEISFGTLLGAVRHNGFIPWDDDFDFFLFEDTYQKAMEVLEKELPEDMFLENSKSEPKYFHDWAHVKDTNSICSCQQFPQDELYSHHGLSVDLYKITKIKTQDFAEFRYQNALAYIDRRMKLGLIEQDDYDKRKKSYEERKLKDCVKTQDSEIYAYPFDIGFQFKDDIFPLKRYKYEDCEFWGPSNAASILTYRYGNYMELPPENQRVPHYSNVTFTKDK